MSRGTICVRKGEYGYSHLDRDFVNNHNWNYHCTMNFYYNPLPSAADDDDDNLRLFNDTVILWNETSTDDPFDEHDHCILSIDGVECNSCTFNNVCANGDERLYIDCSNIYDDDNAVYDECDPYLNGDNTILQIFHPDFVSTRHDEGVCGRALCMSLHRPAS